MSKFIVYTDGGARGNPGPAGYGYVIKDSEGEITAQQGGYLGTATNNVAEYTALIRALEQVIALGAREVDAFSDSELMVRQINGSYKVKNEGLKPLYQQVKQLSSRLQSFNISHVPREQNREADALANQGIDAGQLS